MRWVGVLNCKSASFIERYPRRVRGLSQTKQPTVKLGVTLDLSARHVLKDRTLFRGFPGCIQEPRIQREPVKFPWPIRYWGIRMTTKVCEYGKVGLELRYKTTELICQHAESIDVEPALDVQGGANLGYLMLVVEMLDSLLKTYCDKKANDDCGDMDKEVFPGVDRLVRCVHI
jgi:hypothetical protein